MQRFLAKKGGQLPNLKEMAEGEYLTDDSYFPETRVVFVKMLEGQNGHREVSSMTWNDLWLTEGFNTGLTSVWSFYEKSDLGVTPMDVRTYCESIQDNAQQLLNDAIDDMEAMKP